jgi:cellulose synthase/poly-beta-1,6-N-acetylglucosamine synthase-like glycosyltransferase
MEWVLSTWLALVVLALIVWLGRLVFLCVIDRLLPPLHPDQYADVGDEGLPTVSFVVAAKEESATIAACLQSLCEQDYPNLEVIGINDRSQDQTGSIMDEQARKEPRLKVAHVESLRDGWFGKNNAMREGVERATGQWLCFTDADCVQTSRRSLRTAVRYALEKGVDFLSVLPSHEANSFWERVVQPACSGILMLWFSPAAVNNPRRKTSYANGAFMLVRRACYEAIGGHEAVKNQVNEDMHLARLVKAGGHRLAVVANRGLYTVRMYGTLRETWSGWTRIFAGCFRSVRRLLLAALVLCEFSFLPWVTLMAMVLVSVAGWGDSTVWQWDWLQWIALAACVVQLATMAAFYAINRVPFFYGLIYPLGAVVGLGTLANAMRFAGGRGAITWRGTTYRNGVVHAEQTVPTPFQS